MAGIMFISPHLDDAVFSCSGLIQRLVSGDNRIEIVTCFSAGRTANDPVYLERRREDQLALDILGATGQYLDLPDAPFRASYETRVRRLLFGAVTDDLLTYELLIHKLTQATRRFAPEIVYAPLGVGWHIDHLIVHEAAFALREDFKLLFYADRPYAFIDEQLRVRTGQHQEEMIDRCARALLNAVYVRRFMSAWTFEKFRNSIQEQVQIQKRSYSEVETIFFSAGEVSVARRAIQQYQSQVGDFFESEKDLLQKLSSTPERYFEGKTSM